MPRPTIRCDRCERTFGGDGAFRRGHVFRRGVPVRCRSLSQVQQRVRLGPDDVWHYASRDYGQLRFPLWGRGRPPLPLPIFFLGTAFPRLVRVLRTARGRVQRALRGQQSLFCHDGARR